MLVQLDRDVLPEVLAIVLHPKGRLRAAEGVTLRSPEGSTELKLRFEQAKRLVAIQACRQ